MGDRPRTRGTRRRGLHCVELPLPALACGVSRFWGVRCAAHADASVPSACLSPSRSHRRLAARGSSAGTVQRWQMHTFHCSTIQGASQAPGEAP